MKKNRTDQYPELRKDVLEQFPESEHDSVNEVWNLAGDTADQSAEITASEIESALGDVHTRLQMSGEMLPASDKITGWILQHSRYLVAAIALFAITTLFLFVPKTATVPYGEIATLELPDGTSIEMNSGTTVRYSRLYPFTNRHIELNGEAFFTVTEHSNPFLAEANGAVVEVTGTRFNIRSWSDDPEGKTSVTVSDGQIRFYPAADQTKRIILNMNETSFWNPEMVQPSEAETASPDDALAWREHRFVFHNQTIISILRDLERRFDVAIELEVPEIAHNTLTAYYSQQAHIETILEDICTVKGLRYTKTTNGYRIFE
jgi:transmembrane sensor